MCMGACANSRSCSLKWKDAKAECSHGWLLACVIALVTAEGGDVAAAAVGAPLCWFRGWMVSGALYCSLSAREDCHPLPGRGHDARKFPQRAKKE